MYNNIVNHMFMTRIDIYEYIFVSHVLLFKVVSVSLSVVFFEAGSHIAHAGLKLTIWTEVTLSLRCSCLHLPRVGMTGVHHHMGP